MALTDESTGFNVNMPVVPAYGGYNGNGGGFGFGGDWAWILLLLVLGGGWGGFGGFGMGGMMGAGMMGGMFGMDYLYPWLNNSQNLNDGFRDAQLHDSVTSVRDGISALSTQLCGCCGDMQLGMANGFNGVNNAIFGAQTALAQQMNASDLAALNRSFAEQTANMQGFNGVQAQLAQCCCDNRLATAQTQNIVQVEAAASRASASADTQKILDKLCALELDGVKGQLAQAQRENVALQNAVNMATMQASQTAQTAQILAGQAAEIDGVYNRLKNCPVGTYNVCNPLSPANYGGCGCGGFAN